MDPTYGEVRLAGIGHFEEPEAARRIIGLHARPRAGAIDLKVWEFLDLFADAMSLAGRDPAGAGGRMPRRSRASRIAGRCFARRFLVDKCSASYWPRRSCTH